MSDAPPPTAPYDLLKLILERFPTRLAGSENERGTQQLLAGELSKAGGEVRWHEFTWPPHLYGSLAIHFGLGAAGAAISKRAPLVALGLQTAALASMVSQLMRKGIYLHRLLGNRPSQNLIVTFRAPGDTGPVTKRLVLVAHADSAYTGLIFNPQVLAASLKPPPRPLSFLKKQLRLPVASLAALAGLSALRAAGVSGRSMDVATAIFALPPAIVAALNLDVVLRNQVVPGAADNVSGCVSVVELARKLAPSLTAGQELIAVVTGSEESGTGGAFRLAEHMEGVWDKTKTTVLAIDTMSNGDLVCLEEGELLAVPVPQRLRDAIDATNASSGLPEVKVHPVPAGATDALPFLAKGYEACALTSIDPSIGAPRNYHHPTDTAENVDPSELRRSIDFAEKLCRRLLA